MLGRPSGVGNGNPLQYSHLENSRDRGAWRAYIHQFPWGFRMALNVYINLKINDIFIVLRPFICECLSPPSFTHFLGQTSSSFVWNIFPMNTLTLFTTVYTSHSFITSSSVHLTIFFFFLAALSSLWDLSSPTRDWTELLQWKDWVLTNRSPGNSLCTFNLCDHPSISFSIIIFNDNIGVNQMDLPQFI